MLLCLKQLLCLSSGFQYLREGRMDMDHVGEFLEGGMLAHQDGDLLDDVGSMGAVGMAAENEAVQTTPPFGHPS